MKGYTHLLKSERTTAAGARAMNNIAIEEMKAIDQLRDVVYKPQEGSDRD